MVCEQRLATRCDQYNNQNKKEGHTDSIGPVYLIVGRGTKEQSRQAFLYAFSP